MRQTLISFVPLLVLSMMASAQSGGSSQTPTFSTQVDVVNVFASVRDKKGQILDKLSANDFKLTDNGQPQAIKYFAHDTDLPLTLGLLVDTSMSQRRLIDQEKSASGKFIGQVLRADKDHVFLIHFDSQVELLQDLTNSSEKLNSALDELETPSVAGGGRGGYPGGGGNGGGYPGGGGGGYPGTGGGGGRGGHRGGGGTDLYDAVYLASNDLMSKQQGRKAVIILSDGVDTGSKLSLDEGVQSALKSDTIVYSILFKDDDAYGRPGGGFGYPGGRHGGWGGGGMGGGRFPRQVEHADGKKVLQQISEQTGGRMFEVSKKHPLDEIYQQIQDELRSQYNIGYTPSDRSVGYHKIALTTDQKNALVQTRQGYYARAARTETAAKPGQ